MCGSKQIGSDPLS